MNIWTEALITVNGVWSLFVFNSLVPRIHAEINITHNFTGLPLQQQLHIGVRWLFEVNKYTTNILHTRGKLVPHV
jgi:hypothetical protein